MSLNKKNFFHPKVLRPSILSVIINRINSYKKILDHDVKHEEPEQIDDSNSGQDSNYLWITQDIDSKEFYEKIKKMKL
jgi:hypothetical protein